MLAWPGALGLGVPLTGVLMRRASPKPWSRLWHAPALLLVYQFEKPGRVLPSGYLRVGRADKVGFSKESPGWSLGLAVRAGLGKPRRP